MAKYAHQSVPVKVLFSLSDANMLQTLCNLLQHSQLLLPLSSQVLCPPNLSLHQLSHVVHLHS